MRETKYGPKMKVVTTVKNGCAAQSKNIHPQMPRPDARCTVTSVMSPPQRLLHASRAMSACFFVMVQTNKHGAAPHCPAGHFSPYSDGEKDAVIDVSP